MCKTLGQSLYQRGFPGEQKSIVDGAQAKEVIEYQKTEAPVKPVLEVVNVVAVDPPMVMVTRLIVSFNKFSSVDRSKNKELSRFVFCFRGAPAEHLQQTASSSSS